MNFLAHFLLGNKKEEYIFGNFIGDFVKGKDYELYKPDIQHGILMHRNIDSYADNHPSFLKSKHLLFERYRHFSGVLVDIYYDYLLAKNWDKFSSVDIKEFIKDSYRILDKYQSVMPFSGQVAFKHMRQDDWLDRYTNHEGLTKTFIGMSNFVKNGKCMATGLEELKKHEKVFNTHFLEFFPDMIKDNERFIHEIKK